jgi:hypothetical protein
MQLNMLSQIMYGGGACPRAGGACQKRAYSTEGPVGSSPDSDRGIVGGSLDATLCSYAAVPKVRDFYR